MIFLNPDIVQKVALKERLPHFYLKKGITSIKPKMEGHTSLYSLQWPLMLKELVKIITTNQPYTYFRTMMRHQPIIFSLITKHMLYCNIM